MSVSFIYCIVRPNATILYPIGRPVKATIKLYPIGRSVRATITLYPIGRLVRATITLYPIGRPVRATITLYLIGRPVRSRATTLTCPVLHTVLALFQAVTLNVAMNSHSNVLLTILISNQFVELKGNVFKKFETDNLFQMSCSGQ